jgi:hypothetical protein
MITESFDARKTSWYVLVCAGQSLVLLNSGAMCRYASAASGPKDVVILLDSSASMARSGRATNATAAVRAIMDTLTYEDFVSIIAVRSPPLVHQLLVRV